MASLLKFLKYAPLVWNLFEAGYSLVKGVLGRANAIKKNQNTTTEDKIIENGRKKLIDLGYSFIPAEAQAYASNAELLVFTGRIVEVVNAVVLAVEAFTPLTKK